MSLQTQIVSSTHLTCQISANALYNDLYWYISKSSSSMGMYAVTSDSYMPLAEYVDYTPATFRWGAKPPDTVSINDYIVCFIDEASSDAEYNRVVSWTWGTPELSGPKSFCMSAYCSRDGINFGQWWIEDINNYYSLSSAIGSFNPQHHLCLNVNSGGVGGVSIWSVNHTATSFYWTEEPVLSDASIGRNIIYNSGADVKYFNSPINITNIGRANPSLLAYGTNTAYTTATLLTSIMSQFTDIQVGDNIKFFIDISGGSMNQQALEGLSGVWLANAGSGLNTYCSYSPVGDGFNFDTCNKPTSATPNTGILSTVAKHLQASGYNVDVIVRPNERWLNWVVEALSVAKLSLSAVSDINNINVIAASSELPLSSSLEGYNYTSVLYIPSRLNINIDSFNETTSALTANSLFNVNNVFTNIPSEYNVQWNITPTTVLPITSWPYSGLADTVSSLELTATSAVTYTLTLCLSDFPQHNPFSLEFKYGLPLHINTLNTTTSAMTSQAVMFWPIEDSSPIEQILWYSDIPDDIFVGYTSNTVVDASAFGTIELSAKSADNFIKTYNYYISSTNYGSASDIFRPYLTDTSALSVMLKGWNYDATSTFYVKALGQIGTTYHNIDPSQYIEWYSVSNVDFYTLDNNIIIASTPYPVTYNDDIIIKINNPVTNTVPQEIAYRIYTNLAYGSELSTYIDLTSLEYPGDDIFYPVLKINNEEPTSTLYRAINPNKNYILSAAPDTILNPSTSGHYSFTMDGNIISGGTFIDENELKLASATIFMNVTAATSAVFAFNVSSEYLYESSNSYIIPKSYITTVYFVEVPNVSGCITVAPQYKWDEITETWITVVESDYSVTDPPLDIYGMGRTENFLLSCSLTGVDYTYNWDVSSTNNNYLSLQTSEKYILQSIKSTCSADEADVKIKVTTPGIVNMPEYYNDDVLTPFTNWLLLSSEINYINASIISTSVSSLIPSAIAAPGPLDIIFSNPAGQVTGPIITTINTTMLDLSTSYWRTSATYISNNNALVELLILSETGSPALSVPKFEPTNIRIKMNPNYSYAFAIHPIYNDWCTESQLGLPAFSGSQGADVTSISIVYPVIPYTYTSNKYMTAIADVSFENLIPVNNLVTQTDWYINGILEEKYDFSPFTVSLSDSDIYSLDMTSYWNTDSDKNEYNDVIKIIDNYPVYNPNITRTVNEDIILNFRRCQIGSNEWINHDNINYIIKNVYDNLMDLIYQSKIYINPPTEYIGWLGSITMADNTKRFRWHANIDGLDYSQDDPSIAVNDRFTNLKDCVVRNNIMYVSNTTAVEVLSSDFSATYIKGLTAQSVNVPFINIKTIQIDNEDADTVYVLDVGTSIISVYTYRENDGEWELLYSWYEAGNPQDIYMSKNNTLWVTNADNHKISEYSRSGSLMQTVTSSVFSLSSKPISICEDYQDNLHVLCSGINMVEVFNGTGTLLYSYTPTITGTKIRESVDDGFVYITSPSSTIKCSINGEIQLPLVDINIVGTYTNNNRSIFQDEYRNLYIPQINHILKYNDQLTTMNLINEDVEEKLWSLNEVLINKQEYIQDWVVNKTLNRLWDNINIIYRSLLGKVSYESTKSLSDTEYNITTVPNSINNNCLIDWVPTFTHTLYTDDGQKCIIFPVLRNFLPFEYKSLIYNKEDILIGVNELVTMDVLNRVFCQLNELMQNIKDMLSLPMDKPDNLCEYEATDSIEVLDNNYYSLSECYPTYYDRYGSCQYAIDIIGPLTIPINQTELYTAIVIAPNTCKEAVKKITWSDNGNVINTSYSLDDNTCSHSFSSTGLHTLNVTLSANILINSIVTGVNFYKNILVNIQ